MCSCSKAFFILLLGEGYGFFAYFAYFAVQEIAWAGILGAVFTLTLSGTAPILAECPCRHYVNAMQVKDIKDLVERHPFRPFGVRLNNGAQYSFKEPRDVGAPKDYHLLIYFGEDKVTLIETDSIVEIIGP